jgi:Na+-driven multidrug efflux pump
VALSLWFVQFWGVAGVAFGTVCAYLLEKIVLVVLVRKTYGFRINDYLNLKQHLLYSVLLSGIFVVTEFLIY